MKYEIQACPLVIIVVLLGNRPVYTASTLKSLTPWVIQKLPM